MVKYDNSICTGKMSFEECELAILRQAVDDSDERRAQKMIMNDDIKIIIDILETFLRSKPLICYGGTAINNILPKSDQFYNRDLEIPDYDFYSKNALNDCIELANIYADAGYKDVEAKAGVHHGTFKVYVNFIPIADITALHESIFDELYKESIKVAGIKYASPNFLRMNMYLEMSRPQGDVSRWEKVFKRLVLLNKHYPINPSVNCDKVPFQTQMSKSTIQSLSSPREQSSRVAFSPNKKEVSLEPLEQRVADVIKKSLISLGAVFIGGYACNLYSEYMKSNQKRRLAESLYADFDAIIDDIDKAALIIKEQIEDVLATNKSSIQLIKHAEVSEIIPRHIEIKIGEDKVAVLYEPIACHSYNKIKDGGDEIYVASIDTLLNFYLAFMFSNKKYYNKNKILCMANYLFDVQQHNRLSQKGLLNRFSIDCYGNQQTLEDIRSEKAEKYKELALKRGTPEYDEWFLKYNPNEKRRKPLLKTTSVAKESAFIVSPDANAKSEANEVKPKTKTANKRKPNKRRNKKTRKAPAFLY
jgi:hypothetical protein